MADGIEMISEKIWEYLHDTTYQTHKGGADRSWVWKEGPLGLSVEIPTSRWRDALAERSLAPNVAEGVREALQVADQEGGHVNRSMIGRTTSEAWTVRQLTKAFCLVMSWGAGPRTRGRLSQWVFALDDEDRLFRALRESKSMVLDGRLVDGYAEVLRLSGVGESFGTKWLWACGMSSTGAHPIPQIRDKKVDETLRLLSWTPSGSNQAERWVTYCSDLENCASLINQHQPGWKADGEKIEQLLFDRERGSLHSWLTIRRPPPS